MFDEIQKQYEALISKSQTEAENIWNTFTGNIAKSVTGVTDALAQAPQTQQDIGVIAGAVSWFQKNLVMILIGLAILIVGGILILPKLFKK